MVLHKDGEPEAQTQFYFSDYWHFFVLTSFLPTFITSVLQANIRDVSMEKTHSVLLLLYI